MIATDRSTSSGCTRLLRQWESLSCPSYGRPGTAETGAGVMRFLFILVIACGPVGGLLVGASDSGSTTRALAFVLLGVFLLGGVAMNIWTVRRTRSARER